VNVFFVLILYAGFARKDILKLISHRNFSLQHCGISFVYNVVQRLNRVFSDAGINRNLYSDRLISAAIFKILPDFQTLLTARTR
jgi:hypothetical protein